MNNEAILRQAISLLQAINADNSETVQINNTKFEDGSIVLSVEVTYPATDDEAETYPFSNGNKFPTKLEGRA